VVIGVPKEIKADERRVALVPSGAAAFVGRGHRVRVERGAGLGSGIPDDAYEDAGATIVDDAETIWREAEMVVKVKEPLGDELAWMRPGQVVYTYFHLASNRELTEALLARNITAVAYETIQLDDGTLPLLTPMSEVAGRLAVQQGAFALEAIHGGRGILLSGVSGVRPAHVVVIGAGVAGTNACHIAVGMGAQVTVLDVNPARLRYITDIMHGQVTTLMSNHANIAEEVTQADFVIGSVLIPGARAPRLVTEDLVRRMRPGSAIVDIAIDQGGCCETAHPTTHHDPTYIVHDVVHYCVANMPGAVPRTSTYALTNVTLSYGLDIAEKGLDAALEASPALRRGLNTRDGKVWHPGVAEAWNLPQAGA
jgi:alanine dehydrogenase